MKTTNNNLKNIRNIEFYGNSVTQNILRHYMFKVAREEEMFKIYGDNDDEYFTYGDCGVTIEDIAKEETPSYDFYSVKDIEFHFFSPLALMSDAMVHVVNASEVEKEINLSATPTIMFVEEMDRVGVQFSKVEANILKKVKKALFLQLPIIKESEIHYTLNSFDGLIDLVQMREIIWEKGECSSICKIAPIREEFQEIAQEYRGKILERFSLKEANNIGEKELIDALQKATIKQEVIPLLFGSSMKGKGLEPLEDAIIYYLPSPLDVEQRKELVPFIENPKIKTIAYVYATTINPFVGRVAYVRIYRGSVKENTSIYNLSQKREDKSERILKNYFWHTNEVEELFTGETGALVGCDAEVGDTFCELNEENLNKSKKCNTLYKRYKKT